MFEGCKLRIVMLSRRTRPAAVAWRAAPHTAMAAAAARQPRMTRRRRTGRHTPLQTQQSTAQQAALRRQTVRALQRQALPTLQRRQHRQQRRLVPLQCRRQPMQVRLMWTIQSRMQQRLPAHRTGSQRLGRMIGASLSADVMVLTCATVTRACVLTDTSLAGQQAVSIRCRWCILNGSWSPNLGGAAVP